jgi:hypothetical protein
MTKETIRKNVRQCLTEFFEGYVIIGRIAGADDFVIDFDTTNPETRKRLIIGMSGLLHNDQFMSGDGRP